MDTPKGIRAGRLFSVRQLTLADADDAVAMSGQANLGRATMRGTAGRWKTRVDTKVVSGLTAAPGCSRSVLVAGYQSKLHMTVFDLATVRLEFPTNDEGTCVSPRDVRWGGQLPF